MLSKNIGCTGGCTKAMDRFRSTSKVSALFFVEKMIFFFFLLAINRSDMLTVPLDISHEISVVLC